MFFSVLKKFELVSQELEPFLELEIKKLFSHFLDGFQSFMKQLFIISKPFSKTPKANLTLRESLIRDIHSFLEINISHLPLVMFYTSRELGNLAEQLDELSLSFSLKKEQPPSEVLVSKSSEIHETSTNIARLAEEEGEFFLRIKVNNLFDGLLDVYSEFVKQGLLKTLGSLVSSKTPKNFLPTLIPEGEFLVETQNQKGNSQKEIEFFDQNEKMSFEDLRSDSKMAVPFFSIFQQVIEKLCRLFEVFPESKKDIVVNLVLWILEMFSHKLHEKLTEATPCGKLLKSLRNFRIHELFYEDYYYNEWVENMGMSGYFAVSSKFEGQDVFLNKMAGVLKKIIESVKNSKRELLDSSDIEENLGKVK